MMQKYTMPQGGEGVGGGVEPALEKRDIKRLDRDHSFIEHVLAGQALVTDIAEWISCWHDWSGKERVGGTTEDQEEWKNCLIHKELHEYLGLTWEEYERYVISAGALEDIVAERRAKMKGSAP